MQFCEDHWSRLREAIEKRGMTDLVAVGGRRAAARTQRELEQGEVTLATFDPLMSAHWAIASNALGMLRQAGHPEMALYLMGAGPDDPVDPEVYPEANGRTWPRCPLCYLGLAHELTCDGDPTRCKLPKVDGYAWMIDRAADEADETWKKLKAQETA